jgi:hypothetical protein
MESTKERLVWEALCQTLDMLMCRQSILCSSPFCSLLKDLEGTKLLYGSSPPSQSTKLAGFQQRTASRDSDAKSVVAGILAPLSKQMRTSLLQGLPTCAFGI